MPRTPGYEPPNHRSRSWINKTCFQCNWFIFRPYWINFGTFVTSVFQVQFREYKAQYEISAGWKMALWTPGTSFWGEAVVSFVIPGSCHGPRLLLLVMETMICLTTSTNSTTMTKATSTISTTLTDPLLDRHVGDPRRLWLWSWLSSLLSGQLHLRPDKGEEHRQQDKPVEEPEDDGEDEDLEEGEEGVRGGAGKEDEGEEGGDASVQDGGADRLHCAHCSLAFWPLPQSFAWVVKYHNLLISLGVAYFSHIFPSPNGHNNIATKMLTNPTLATRKAWQMWTL